MVQKVIESLTDLPPDKQAHYRDFVTKVEKVKGAHPEYSEEAIKALDARQKHELHSLMEIERLDDRINRNPNIKADRTKVQEEVNKLGKKLKQEWLVESSKYGADGARALNNLNSEVRPGIIRSITKNFIDPNDGGIQFGGIAGAIGGALLGATLFGGIGGAIGAGWMGIAALIGGVLAGGFIGNKGGDMIKGLFRKKAEPAAAAPEVAAGKAQTVEIEEPETAVETQRLATEHAAEVQRLAQEHKNSHPSSTPFPGIQNVGEGHLGAFPAGTAGTGTPTTHKENERK